MIKGRDTTEGKGKEAIREANLWSENNPGI